MDQIHCILIRRGESISCLYQTLAKLRSAARWILLAPLSLFAKGNCNSNFKIQFLFVGRGFSFLTPQVSSSSKSCSSTRSMKLLRDGAISKAFDLSFSSDTFQKLVDLHPSGPNLTNLVEPASCSFSFSAESVVSAIRTYPKGSAGGPFGWTLSHFPAVLSADLKEILVFCLTAFKQFLLFCSVFCLTSSKLLALSKPNGGVRPIAKLNSDVFRKSSQFGVSCPNGSEAIVHYLRSLRFSHPSSRIISVDIRNAFNCVDRIQMLKAVKQFPDLLPFFFLGYSTPSDLFFDNHCLSSSQGVRQGDPLGPFLYSLTTLPVLSWLNSLSGVSCVAYLDDTYIVIDSDVDSSDLLNQLSQNS
ncbi:hypothetical protein GEMRC1_013227 [Eukaryota sp. GEM-RC1]